MAVEKLDKDDSTDDKKPAKKKSPVVKIILIVVGVLVLAGGGAGVAIFMSGGGGHGKGASEGHKEAASDKPNKAPAVYFAFDPAFVVNFQDDSSVRFLQITVEVMARDPLVIEAVKTHTPLIRNNLVMLFSTQTPESISTRQGKEKIRADALKEIQKIMKEQTGSTGVEAVYFTSFVMQ